MTPCNHSVYSNPSQPMPKARVAFKSIICSRQREPSWIQGNVHLLQYVKSISNGANEINYVGGSSLSTSISFVKNSSGLCFHLRGKPKAEAGPSLSGKQQWGVFLPRGCSNYQLDCRVRKLKRVSESSWVQSLRESWSTTRQCHNRLSVCKQGCFPSAGSAGKGALCRKDYSWFQFSSQVEIRSSDKEGEWKNSQLLKSKNLIILRTTGLEAVASACQQVSVILS